MADPASELRAADAELIYAWLVGEIGDESRGTGRRYGRIWMDGPIMDDDRLAPALQELLNTGRVFLSEETIMGRYFMLRADG